MQEQKPALMRQLYMPAVPALGYMLALASGGRAIANDVRAAKAGSKQV